MKKLLYILSITFLLSGCATTRQHQTYTKKQGFMMLEHTEMHMNKKYNSKHNKSTKRKSARKYKRK